MPADPTPFVPPPPAPRWEYRYAVYTAARLPSARRYLGDVSAPSAGEAERLAAQRYGAGVRVEYDDE